MNKKNTMKKAVLITGMSVITWGGAYAQDVKSVARSSDIVSESKTNKDAQRLIVGRYMGQRLTNIMVDDETIYIEYYLDTNDDGLTDAICYKISEKFGPFNKYKLNEKLSISEKFVGDKWIISDIAIDATGVALQQRGKSR